MLGSTETYLDTDTKLKRIAWLSASDPCEESRAACFHELDGNKVMGIDEIKVLILETM